MLLFTAIKASIFAIISKGLASYLEVSVVDIETQLLNRDAHLRLRNVKVREMKIPIAIQSKNVVCYLILTGTIEELVLDWTWSTFSTPQIVENVTLELNDVQLKVSFRYEKESEESIRARTEPMDYFDEPEQEEDLSAQLKSRWAKEMDRLSEAIRSQIRESKHIKQAIKDVMDCFSIQVRQMSVDVHVPFTSDRFELGFKSFSLGCSSDDVEFKLRPLPVKLAGSFEQIYANLHLGLGLGRTSKEKIPVLEPLSIDAKIRRVAGKRMQDWTQGYEIIFNGTHDSNIPKDNSRGILVHVTDKLKKSVSEFREATKGEATSTDYDGDIYNSQRALTQAELWPTSLKLLVVLFAFIGVVNATLVLRFILKYSRKFSDEHLAITTWVAAFSLSVAATVVLVNFWIGSHRRLFVERIIEAGLRMQDQENLYPAVFRLPLPFITVIDQRNVRITLTDVSVVGQMDFTKLHFSSTDLTVRSPVKRTPGAQVSTSGVRSPAKVTPGPQVSASGLRGIYHSKKLLVNIDLIDNLFIPGSVHLTQSITNSVIVFEEGRMMLKLKTIKAQVLSGDGDIIGEGDALRKSRVNVAFGKVQNAVQKTVDFTGRTVHNTGKTVTNTVTITGKKLTRELENGFKNTTIKMDSKVKKSKKPAEKDARNRLRAEVYEGLIKLQRMAAMFEQIPLQKHRQNFRFYFGTFSGKEGVDFMLENSMASNRVEAVKLLRDFETEFNLFVSATKDYRFRDKEDYLYRFVPPEKRRFWVKNELPYDYVETFERVPQSIIVPFPITICVNGVILIKQENDDDESTLLTLSKGVVFLENGTLSRSINFTVLARGLRSNMIALTNARFHGIVDPETPNLVHRLQVSLDQLSLNPEYTIEDWLDTLGFVFDDDDDDDDEKKALELRQKDDDANHEPFALPHVFVSDFNFEVSWEGTFVNTQQKSKRMDGFSGDESTTSGDLIQEFIFKVLGQAPGLLTNMSFMGVNFGRSAGMGYLMHYGANFLPSLGQYVTIAAMAVYDVVEMSIDASKANRNDPNGKYKIGDFTRGIWFAGIDTARSGAEKRGKDIEDFYDEEDRVRVDPIDFIVGAEHGIASYANENKAKYAGAFISASSVIALSVVLGPIGGIAAGILLGVATEQTILVIEKRLKGDKGDDDENKKDSDFLIDDED